MNKSEISWKIEINDTFSSTEEIALSLEWIAEKLRRGYKSGDEVCKWKATLDE